MVTQFVPAPIAWELKVRYELPAWARGYDGWKPQAFPVIGWEYDTDESPALEAWVSYKGEPTPVPEVLRTLKAEATVRLAQQRLSPLSGEFSISYELAPA